VSLSHPSHRATHLRCLLRILTAQPCEQRHQRRQRQHSHARTSAVQQAARHAGRYQQQDHCGGASEQRGCGHDSRVHRYVLSRRERHSAGDTAGDAVRERRGERQWCRECLRNWPEEFTAPRLFWRINAFFGGCTIEPHPHPGDGKYRVAFHPLVAGHYVCTMAVHDAPHEVCTLTQ
jgi:hypothetical protein